MVPSLLLTKKMNCPHCDFIRTEIYRTDTRTEGNIPYVIRRRVCANCKTKFTTYECADIKTLAQKISKTATLMKALSEMKHAVGVDE